MASNNSMKGRSGNYTIYKCIGKGAYGEVFLARYKKEKKLHVMKNIRLANSSKKERLAAEREASLLSQLQHPNIVSYKESFQDSEGCLHIVMGYCEGGDLCTRLKAQNGVFLPESQVVEWFVQIALALQYLHERNILHRDLKTQNIFLTKADIIKVGDLGIARVLDCSSELAQTVIGTPYYMSPEIFQNQAYNQKSDIWALGCCVYEMSTLKHAFTAKNIHALMIRVVKGELPEMPSHYSADVRDLIKWMLSKQADDRPCAPELLRVPFVRQHIKMFLERANKRKQKRQLSSNSTSSLTTDNCTTGDPQRLESRAQPEQIDHAGQKDEVEEKGKFRKEDRSTSVEEASSEAPSMDQQSRVSSSNSQTLVIPPSDPETLVRSSSFKSRSSGYHSNDDVSPVPKDDPVIPSKPLPTQKNSQKEKNVGRKEIIRVSEKAEMPTKKLPVKHSKSDGHEKHSSPRVLHSQLSSSPKTDKKTVHSPQVRASLSEGSDEHTQKSSSATSLSSARERRRKHKQEKQQNARRSFSGPKMVLKSRSSNDVKSDRTPPTPEGKESVCESKPSDCKGGLILKPEQDTHTPEETDGPQSPEGRLQPGSDWSKHVQSGLQQMKDNVQQPPVDKPGGKSVGDNLLQRDNSTEPSLHIGGHHSQGNSPLVGDRKTKAEATSLQRGHSSEPDLCSKENAVVTDAHRDYTLLRPPSGVCEDNLYQSEGSTDSLDRLVAGKKQVAEGIGEKRSEEFDSMLTIMDETLHLPPSEERRELTPTPPKVAFVTDSQPGGRLQSRIEALRKELSSGLGEELFAKAYNVLESGLDTEDEEKLLKSLGEVFYTEYSEKLRQLKFCEESAF